MDVMLDSLSLIVPWAMSLFGNKLDYERREVEAYRELDWARYFQND
jgi:hypothetical protein